VKLFGSGTWNRGLHEGHGHHPKSVRGLRPRYYGLRIRSGTVSEENVASHVGPA
jgi:hypothetical protein